MKKFEVSKKSQVILLAGNGIANVGGWVYHIALNLMIFNQTGSAIAVTGLYLLKPLATLLTNGWLGSVVDRVNKRRFMIMLLFIQAIFISFLPFFTSLWLIYSMVLVVNIGNSMFHPASITYMTKLIPIHERKKFNSFRSLMDSGAFLIGPAIAGLIFMIGTPTAAIYANAIAMAIAGCLIKLLPDLEGEVFETSASSTVSFAQLTRDWRIVYDFSKKSRSVVVIYFLFSAVTVMTWGVDSLEAAFAKEVLELTNTEYGFLVSMAGGGILVGAILNTVIISKLSTSILMGMGSILLSFGYFLFATSSNYTMASIGCFILSFSLAFANTGFLTFYQNNIPVDVMGRIISLFGFAEAMAIIIVMLICGSLAHFVSIQFSVIAGVIVMCGVAIMVFANLFLPIKWRKVSDKQFVK